jgi:response regulator RpfG family c-di-GMP phosphodiesterase
MSSAVLICHSDDEWTKEASGALAASRFVVDSCHTGKECQLKVYQGKYVAVVIDVDVQNHSAILVLKFLCLNHPSIKVILTFKSKKRFDEIGFTQKELKELGASEILFFPFSHQDLAKKIEGASQFEDWKRVKASVEDSKEVEVRIRDDEFTRIKISDFYTGKVSIFDYYVKLTPNKYVKILHKGDSFERARFNHYIKSGKVDYLYFLTRDRASYINYMNVVLEKLEKSPGIATQEKVNALNNVVEKYIEEIQVAGLKPQLLDEGKKICESMYKVVSHNKDLQKLLSSNADFDPRYYNHIFLVSLFSSIVCTHLEWASKKSIDLVAFGAFVHDIGKVKMPKALREKPAKDFSAKEREIFERHPKDGYDLLVPMKDIPEQVKEIVYQHHELVSGMGFPSGLRGVKIFPLAKIVGFSDRLSHIVIDEKLCPSQAYEFFLKDKKQLDHYDSQIIKAFSKSLIKG